jgi:hypothetical protein
MFAPRRRKRRRQGIAELGSGQSSRLQAAAIKANTLTKMDQQTYKRLKAEGRSSNEIEVLAEAELAAERRNEAWAVRQEQFRLQALAHDRAEERRLAEARLLREQDAMASAQSRRASR